LAPDDDWGLEESFGDANGPAYQKTEERTGPPLSYVAEKLRHSLQSLHALHRALTECPRDDLELPSAMGAPVTPNRLRSTAWMAFRQATVSYLALEDMLGLANDTGLFDGLLAMSDEDFRLWLHRIASEGSETG